MEVASCCHEPPAYEPRRSPAAVGLEIPVPPLPAVSAFWSVSVPIAPVCAERLVEEAVVEKKFVEVAFVVVEF